MDFLFYVFRSLKTTVSEQILADLIFDDLLKICSGRDFNLAKSHCGHK